MKLRLMACGGTLAVLLPALPVLAAEPPGSASDCGGCHALAAEQNQTLEQRTTRQGPPLYYAGNKFREDWLVDWLQDPVRIRPAGDYAPAHTVTEAAVDHIDTTSLVTHPVLNEAEAREVAAWLMTLTPHDDLIAAEADYEPGTVNPRLGAMDFVKFKGCGGCHQDDPEYGGSSGPELYTAWQRMQPAFINSYIRDPSQWEPYSLMPNKALNTDQIHKLTDYLKLIGGED